MKKRIAVLLTLVMIFSVFCAVPASADGEDTFHFHTRTAEYSFKVGDTFTYSYWLNLNPSILAELGDYTGVKALYLEKMIGNIMYDTDCLTVIKTEMPQFSSLHSRVFQKNDVLDGSLIDDGVLDFTNDDLGFYALGKLTDEEKNAFSETNIAVSITFRVTAGNTESSYMRTRLRNLTCTTDTGKEVVLVHRDQSTFRPYVSYETINDEQPSVVLKSLVDDCGMDVRYMDVLGNTIDGTGIRPDGEAVVVMYGFTTDGRYVKLTEKYTGQKVVWFFDVPYGQYYVECYFTDSEGNYYATPDPEKAEHVNVPATGEVQALWLVKADPDEVMRVNISINWVGDKGYIPARPDYLLAELYSGSTTYVSRSIARTETQESINYVKINDEEGNKIDYSLRVSPVSTDSKTVPYTFAVEKTGEDYIVTATYVGLESDLGEVSGDGHYWKTISETEGTCTEPGSKSQVCEDCHSVRKVETPALGHDPVIEPGRSATCTMPGLSDGYHCGRCGEILATQEPVPALGHLEVIDPAVEPTEESRGLTEGSHCGRCGIILKVQQVVPAIGEEIPEHEHIWDAGCVTLEATCVNEGQITYSCAVCGTLRVEALPMTDHVVETRGYREPGCTYGGYSGDQVCVYCGTLIAKGTETEPAGHSWGEGLVIHQASCVSEGQLIHTCTKCGKTQMETIPMTDHTLELRNQKAATCTEDGYTGDEVCTVCGVTVRTGTVEKAKDHSWGVGKVTKGATCQAEGEMSYTCSVCGETKTIPVDKTDHKIELQNEKEASCTVRGYTGDKVCTVCGEVVEKGEYIDPSHSWNGGTVTRAPTSLADGVMTYTCTKCGATKTESIPHGSSGIGGTVTGGGSGLTNPSAKPKTGDEVNALLLAIVMLSSMTAVVVTARKLRKEK